MSEQSEKRHANIGIHGSQHHHAAHPHRGPILRRARLISLGVLICLGLGGVATFALRANHAHALEQATAEHSKLYVTTVNAKPASGKGELTLPGTLQGIIEAPIYSRSSGYVLRWNKDIGARVAKGDVLAEIDTPEIDQQLAQAIAARDQAASSLDLAKTSAERWEALRKKDAVTQQELNERSSAFTQAKANLAAANANVLRLQRQEQFKRIIAPFSGVITRRNVEVGDLIDAGNGGAAKALFSLAQVDTLRVYVYVPQAYAQRIKAGDTVSISQKELSGQIFHGTVARTAGAIDVATRTMQLEINLPNKDNTLLAGAYVEVALPVGGTSNILTVPSNVILFRPEGTRVAIVDAKGTIQLRTVKIGHDLGNKLEILDGISVNDKLVLNPADSLADKDTVIVLPAKPEEEKKAAA
ncbi:efflux RND transporter periplasmic adaptor subunit [Undibacterium jejuense]|uniref:Efflux RND transporter periplasmic adaptor subunit n=1 Tax=Undibacterium jejuense TaxID=1344949 RepID=A0A923HLL5_9BURK|nr:efflux RND transporter periplasmic adaptor subunit [Undibacterium jejuense]MBC3861891.1 efflux RND transporter periplasmic adaptor subunit [Undibacterium jejuense]